MRRGLVATAVVGALASSPVRARAEELPPRTIGFVFGVLSVTRAHAKRLGDGYYQYGMHAAWQPTATDRRWGWTIRWGTMGGTLYSGTAAQIDTELHTMQIDLAAGLRFRPWDTPTRYLAARVGGE